MAYKQPRNPNKPFLIGAGILAFAVICIVVLFTLLALRMSSKSAREIAYTDVYHITLEKGFVGDSISIYLNDSLLLNRTVEADTLQLQVQRFDETNALLVVDNPTEQLTTFNLSEKGGKVILRKAHGIISMTTME